jgi:hypothetical protein
MPGSRSWSVTIERTDGRFAALEGGAGWVYRDRKEYDAYHEAGDSAAIVDAGEWPRWGPSEPWADSLAGLIGGEPYQSGGNIWVVLYT